MITRLLRLPIVTPPDFCGQLPELMVKNDCNVWRISLTNKSYWSFYLHYELTEISYTHRKNIRAHMEQRILIWDKFKANVHALEHIKYSFLHVLPFDLESHILYTLM